MIFSRTVALAAISLVFLALPASAQGKSKGKKATTTGESRGEVRVSGRATSRETQIVHDYYATHHTTTKPLPPGILMNLNRGKPLPPGIERTRIDHDLVVRLPVRSGQEWLVVGDRLVLVDRYNRIVDVLRLY